MKRTLLACVAVGLVVPASASAKKPIVPSEQGYLLLREVGTDCQVAVTDVDVDLTGEPPDSPVYVTWRIDTKCADTYKMAIGRFTSKNGDVWPVLDCGSGVTSGEVKCRYNWDCPDKAYKFTVCVDGAKVVDPELRIKGGRFTGGGCTKLSAAQAAATCEGASHP